VLYQAKLRIANLYQSVRNKFSDVIKSHVLKNTAYTKYINPGPLIERHFGLHVG
jgi:hypothetical protein